jgi:phosphatidylserine decarboxylase
VSKGQELGWFQHGSTIIVFAPPGFTLCEGVSEGARIRMGEPLMRLPETVTEPSDKLHGGVMQVPEHLSHGI